MRWRAAVFVGTVSMVVLAMASPAVAKGADQATITGPGLAHPIVVGGDGEPGSGEQLGELSEGSGLFAAIFGPGGADRPLTSEAPAGSLGPKYELSYRIPGATVQGTTLRQDLYPSAVGGPVTYTSAGQVVFGTPSAGGWYRVPDRFGSLLVALGVPATDTVASSTPSSHESGGSAAAASSSAGSGHKTPWVAIVAGVLVLGVLLIGAIVVRARRRPIGQP